MGAGTPAKVPRKFWGTEFWESTGQIPGESAPQILGHRASRSLLVSATAARGVPTTRLGPVFASGSALATPTTSKQLDRTHSSRRSCRAVRTSSRRFPARLARGRDGRRTRGGENRDRRRVEQGRTRQRPRSQLLSYEYYRSLFLFGIRGRYVSPGVCVGCCLGEDTKLAVAPLAQKLFSDQVGGGHRGGAAGTPWRLGRSCHLTRLASQLASQQCTQMPQNGTERPFRRSVYTLVSPRSIARPGGVTGPTTLTAPWHP